MVRKVNNFFLGKSVIFFLTFLLSPIVIGKSHEYDIIVYGATSAGVSAAVQASRVGRSVALISVDGHVGGVTASGLTATDMNNHKAIGGVSREFYQRIYDYYSDSSAWDFSNEDQYFRNLKKRVYGGISKKDRMQWVFESHVAEKIFRQLIEEANVDLIEYDRLDLNAGVLKIASELQSITMESGDVYSAKVFIDTSYEGDLMALSGVSYITGREGLDKYGEDLAGIRINEVYGYEGQSIDPYIEAGVPESGLLPFIEKDLNIISGTQDHRVQAYCFRLTLTNNPLNHIAIYKPDNYQPLWYEYLARRFQLNPNLPLNKIMTFTSMPNGKTDTNGIDFVGANYNYAEASYDLRDDIYKLHKDFALGMLWFLSSDSRVPLKIRKQMNNWGLAKDEFKDNGHFPHQLYVRESRRMVSDYVMTQHNGLKRTLKAPNSIGLATYAMDSHVVRRILSEDGKVYEEGHFYEMSPSYPVSYHSIVPKSEEAINLLVPVTLSASHVAYGSIRMEPVYMVLAQSAAIAADLSIKLNQPVQDIPYYILRGEMLKHGQIIQEPTIWNNIVSFFHLMLHKCISVLWL